MTVVFWELKLLISSGEILTLEQQLLLLLLLLLYAALANNNNNSLLMAKPHLEMGVFNS